MAHFSPAALANCRLEPLQKVAKVAKAVNEIEHDIKLPQMSGYHLQGCYGIGYMNTPKTLEEKSAKLDWDFSFLERN